MAVRSTGGQLHPSVRTLSIRHLGYILGQVFAAVACVIGFAQYLSIKGSTHITAHLDGEPIEAPLVIDGRRMGTTPYYGSLSMGMHTVWVLPPDGIRTDESMIEFEVTSIVQGAYLDADFHLAPSAQAARPLGTHSPR